MAKVEIKRNPAAKQIADLILNNYEVKTSKDVHIFSVLTSLFFLFLLKLWVCHLHYLFQLFEINVRVDLCC